MNKILNRKFIKKSRFICFDKCWKTNTKNHFSFQLNLDVGRSALGDDFLHLDRPWQAVLQLPLRGHPHSWRGFGLELNSFATSFPGLLPEATFPSPQPGQPPLRGEGCLSPHLWMAVGAIDPRRGRKSCNAPKEEHLHGELERWQPWWSEHQGGCHIHQYLHQLRYFIHSSVCMFLLVWINIWSE